MEDSLELNGQLMSYHYGCTMYYGSDEYRFPKPVSITYDRSNPTQVKCWVFKKGGQAIEFEPELTGWGCSRGVDDPDAETQWCVIRSKDGSHSVNLTYKRSAKTLTPFKIEVFRDLD